MSSADENNEVYDVEKILKKRIKPGGGIMYLIKWKDFPGMFFKKLNLFFILFLF